MLETVHEIAIYVHRFHNLDLFQQGWYQIKISAMREDPTLHSYGIPSRVIQYEVPNIVPDNIFPVWRIDDTEHSFSTQSFKVKYARQDVHLSIMVSFNFAIGKDERPLNSAVVLKFELMYAPLMENCQEIQAPFVMLPTAVHEFRIPPKALLGLHSYCPVHFDAFNSVLIDLSIHIVFLKSATSICEKVPSKSPKADTLAQECYDEADQE